PHVSWPGRTGGAGLRASVARAVMHDLRRDELAFDGLTISDALDMRSLPQGPEQAIDVIAAMRAGVDLLLLTPDEQARARIESAVVHAAARGLLDSAEVARSSARLMSLRSWLAEFDQPD